MALIVASSLVALASPFLLRAVIDDALPQQDVRLLLLAVGGMLAVTVVTAVLGVLQTWLSTPVGPARHARAAHRRLRATCSASRSASSPAPAAARCSRA